MLLTASIAVSACTDGDRTPALLDQQVVTEEDVPIDLAIVDHAGDRGGDTRVVTRASAEPHRADILDGAIIRVTPARDFHGTIHVSYQVRDEDHGTVDGAATVTVRPVNDAPVAAGGAQEVHDQAAIVLQASDVDGDALSYELVNGPGHGTITGTPPALQYVPARGFAGDDAITYRVFDGAVRSAPATLHLHVAAGAAPVAVAGSVSGNEDQPLDVILHGTGQSTGSLAFTIETSPRHGTLRGTPPNLTYTPAPDFAGDDSLEFSVSDGVLSSSKATITIHVAPVNDPPVATPRTIAATEDTSTTIKLDGRDPDGDPLTFQVRTQPAHGTLGGAPPALQYTPAANYSGPDSFTYVASDGGATSAPATVTIGVQAVNDPPVPVNSAVTTLEDTSITIRLQATDIDTPQLTFAIVTRPTDGHASLSGTNLTYAPALNATGTRVFTFRVSDGTSAATGTVTLQITPVDDPPAVRDDFVATDPGAPLTFSVIANDADPDGDPIELDSVDAPAHGTIAIVGDELVYTPDAGFTGVEVFGYTIVDTHGNASTGHAHVGVGTFPPGAPTETIGKIGGAISVTSLELIPAISSNGRFIAFTSMLALVSDDTNGLSDVYLYDRSTRALTRISVATTGSQGNGPSQRPHLSADGRYAVFESSANNLVAGDSNGVTDVFRHDRVTGETVRINVATGGSQANASSSDAETSDDGNLVVFTSRAFNLVADDANGVSDIFLRDVAAGTTTRLSVGLAAVDGNLDSTEPAISGDGRFVAFTSAATNLIADDTNNQSDIFVRDRVAGTTTRVSVSTSGGEANRPCTGASLSRDGRFVAFLSTATNLVPGTLSSAQAQAYIRDVQSATTSRVPGAGLQGRISSDGRYVAVHGSFSTVHDRVTANTLFLSSFELKNAFPVVSGDGRYLVMVDVSASGTIIVQPNPL